MHISSKSVILDSIIISSEAGDFYSAIRSFEKSTFDLLEESEDENLLVNCQVVGYEIIRIIFQSKNSINLSISLQVNDNGTEMAFYADHDAFELLKTGIIDDGYFRNKLAFICDNYVIDERNRTLTCLFDGKSFNRQLSSDRILTLKKYMKNENINTNKFHDSI